MNGLPSSKSFKVLGSETRCYFEFCLRRPHAWPDLISYVLNRARLRGIDRLHALWGGDNKLRHYPDEIRKQVRNLPEATIREDWLNHLPFLGWSPGKGPSLRSW